jgi:signal transduction histidine kinase
VPTFPTRTDGESATLLRQMEQFFQATTDAIVFLDRDYNFTFLNDRAREIISMGRDLRGQNLFKTFPAADYPGSPYVESYRRSMDEGLPASFEAFYPEPLNVWLRVQSYPTTDDGIIIFFRDFTAEKLDRDALQRKTEEAERQHAELETIYRTAPIGLALFDLDDYHYLRLNDRQAAFFGLPPEQIVGRTLTEMAPIPGLRELFDQVRDGKPVINYPLEGTLVTDPAEYRYWTVSYFPVHAPDGSIQAISAASLEITQQRKSELALIQSEKLAVVGRLASSIAHEINNPLESVTNLIYLAKISDSLDEARDYLNTAEVELRRASAITSQTLRFHRQASSPQQISVADLLDTVFSIYQGRIANAHVQVQRRSRCHRKLHCFDGEIRQVLSNLVSNALDAMPGGGCLFVREREAIHWRTGEPGVTITIADNAAGMSPETQAKIYNPFFTTKGVTGTGLGLWVSKEIVHRHRGSLSVRSSQSPAHHGTVFTLFLPFDAVIR